MSESPEKSTPGAAAPGDKKAPGEKKRRHWWHHWVKPLLVILLVVGSFRSAIADWNDVPTGSMKPTILVGDRIFVNKLAYDLRVPFLHWRLAGWEHPSPGEVVVLISPLDSKRLVKRVVGVPGDRLAIRDRRVWLDGRPLDYELTDPETLGIDGERVLYLEELRDGDSHPVQLDRGFVSSVEMPELVIPPGHYFVMGDNRDHSLDSRFFGLVSRDRILGRAEAVVLSVDLEQRYRPRWERFFSALR